MHIEYKKTKYEHFEKELYIITNTETNEVFLDYNYMLDEDCNPIYLTYEQWKEYRNRCSAL